MAKNRQCDKIRLQSLDNLKKLLHLIFPDLPDVDSYMEELRSTLLSECDYLKEKENIEWFRKHLVPEVEAIYIPKVFSDFTTEQILTMEFVEGDDYEKTKKLCTGTQDFLGQSLYDAHMISLFKAQSNAHRPTKWKLSFKTDKIIMLDFGSVRSFPKDFMESFINIIKSIEVQDFNLYQKVHSLPRILRRPKRYRTSEDIYSYFRPVSSLHKRRASSNPPTKSI